jgi:pectate lyase
MLPTVQVFLKLRVQTMEGGMRKLLLIPVLLSLLLIQDCACALPTFPGAEGFGSDTPGGRGGAVYLVTNLNDSGAGSLRAAIEASGPRIVVFTTGGTISLQSTLTISNPFLTIAGQSAPGGGITIRGNGRTGIRVLTHDIVIRYLTARIGSGGQTNAILIASNGSTNIYNIVIDHCSLSWATDEVLTTWYRARDVTLCWNIVSEGLDCSTHPKGCHSKGNLAGGYALSESKQQPGAYNISLHHNLYAHNVERGPMLKGSGVYDVVNNVSYNYRWSFSYFDFTGLSSGGQTPMRINYFGNYFKRGPNSTANYEISSVDNGGARPSLYVYGNIGPNRTQDSDPQDACLKPRTKDFLVSNPIPISKPINATTAINAYGDVLAAAGNSIGVGSDGATFSRRDSIDARVIVEVENRSGRIIDDESDVGGWVSIAEGTAYTDTDRDGMPDVWENLQGLNPNDPSDNIQDANGDGYTNIEEYLNSSSPGGPDPGDPPAPPTGLVIVR